jgi:CubicO group peptidase (beta-lactamase class C family)
VKKPARQTVNATNYSGMDSSIGRAPVLIALAGVLFCSAGTARADDLDDAVVAIMQKRHIPGLSLAIVRDGKIIRAQGYGVSELGGSVPVTERTLFQAGSVSKPVTALAAMRLVDAGKISLDVDINSQLKSWKVPDGEFTVEQKVTLRRLLTHTSGLNVEHYPGYQAGSPRPTLLQVLDGEAPANTPRTEVEFIPGTKTRYSGAGYSVVQQLLMDATGKPFPDVMRSLVLDPLGMDSSGYDQPPRPELMARTAAGYYADGKPVPGRWHVYPEMAAAGLWTTPSDLARVILSVQNSVAGNPGALLAPESAAAMVTRDGDWGVGFAAEGQGETRRFLHDGRDDGFDTLLVGYAQTGEGAVVMINANDNTNVLKHVFAAIVKEYGWRDYVPVKQLVAIEDGRPDLTEQVQGVFKLAQLGRFDRSVFTETLGGQLAAMSQDNPILQQLRALGALMSIALVAQSEANQIKTYRYRIVFENDVILANCGYDSAGKIARLSFALE